MNYIVKISWYSGGCELLADEFFPTTIEKTRKLFKLLVADPGWDDGKVRELLDYFKERKVREVKKAEEARSMAQGLMWEAEVIMLKGFGVAQKDAAAMAMNYTELTYDIWAGYNDIYKSFEDAAIAVRSAIAGEVEPIRRAGFTIVDSQLKITAANYGIAYSTQSASEELKSYLRYLSLAKSDHKRGGITFEAAKAKNFQTDTEDDGSIDSPAI